MPAASGSGVAFAQAPAYQRARFYATVLHDSKVFPVLLPGDGRWLNWRDTYGAPRMRLVNGVWQQVGVHQGIDIFAEKGTPVVSISSGRVENVGWTFYSGWRVGIRGSDGRYYFYAHMLNDFPSGIVRGARVSPGALLGYLGNSGYGPEGTQDEFPPHLHFGLQSSSGWENPNAMLTNLYDAGIAKIKETKLEIRRLNENLENIRQQLQTPGAEVELLQQELAATEQAMRQAERALFSDM